MFSQAGFEVRGCERGVEGHELRQYKQKRGSTAGAKSPLFLFILPKFWVLENSFTNS